MRLRNDSRISTTPTAIAVRAMPISAAWLKTMPPMVMAVPVTGREGPYIFLIPFKGSKIPGMWRKHAEGHFFDVTSFFIGLVSGPKGAQN